MLRALSSRTPQRLGPEAERRARRHFALRGYRILATNVWIGGYELDLVVRRGRRVVVCEVKAKGGSGFGDPAEMVTPEKARRVRRSAEAWLARHPELADLDIELEAVAVQGRRIRRMPMDV